jgi:hypothetical protein
VHRSKAKHLLHHLEESSAHTAADQQQQQLSGQQQQQLDLPSPPLPQSIMIPYSSACRALLVGIGADEQMAGGHGSTDGHYDYDEDDDDHDSDGDSDDDGDDDTDDDDDDDDVFSSGYGRHRTVFRRHGDDGSGGWQRLVAEMNIDLDRLWRRNLGR